MVCTPDLVHKLPGLNSTGGGIRSWTIHVGCFITQSLSSSPFHPHCTCLTMEIVRDDFYKSIPNFKMDWRQWGLVFKVRLLHSADYIFISFGIIGPIVISVKMEFCSGLCERA